MSNDHCKHYVILGGGICGLALGWFLQQKKELKAKITLIEKDQRIGGWIHTTNRGGFQFEKGPRSCRVNGGLHTLQLIEELGLESDLIVADPSAHKRFLYQDQHLLALPRGPLTFLFSRFFPMTLKALLRDWRAPLSENEDDETIYEFICRRLGVKVAEQIFDPLIKGIYAGDIRELSMRSCFPILHQWEKEKGSLLSGFLNREKKKTGLTPFIQKIQKESLFSFREGMQSLPKRLAEKLTSSIRLECVVEGLTFQSNHIDIHLSGGKTLKADRLFSTLPARILANLLPPTHSEISHLLRQIPSKSVAVVNVGFKKKVLNQKGFGYLVASQEKEKILGVVWDSCVFPQQAHFSDETRLTVMIGEESLLKENVEMIALEALRRHLNIKTSPDELDVQIAHQAIPQYQVGHSHKIIALKEKLSRDTPYFHVLGSSYGGVSVNECIAQAKTIVDLIS